MDGDIIAIREVAVYLKLAEKTAHRHAADGKIPDFKDGGAWRFRRSEVDPWIERQSAGQNKPDTRRGSNVWHEMHAHFEPDAYPEVRR